MFVSSTHSLNQDFAKSMQEFRKQLDEQKKAAESQEKKVSEGSSPNVSEPAEQNTPYQPVDPVDPYRVPGSPTFVDQTNPLDTVQSEVSKNREAARQAAVLASQANHRNNLIDTYTKTADSNSAEDNKVSVSQVYNETKDYYTRKDLIKGFEKATEPDDLFTYNYNQIRIQV